MDDPSSINAFFDHWEMKKINTDQSLMGDEDLNKVSRLRNGDEARRALLRQHARAGTLFLVHYHSPSSFARNNC